VYGFAVDSSPNGLGLAHVAHSNNEIPGMPDILTALTSIAVSFFRAKSETSRTVPDWFDSILSPDPVLQEAQRTAFVSPASHEATIPIVDLVFADPEFSSISPRTGELDPLLLYPNGGQRISPANFIDSIFSSAQLQMFYLRLPQEEGLFVRTVLEGFEELRRAVRGERVRAYAITGLARVSLPEGVQISTPWGVIRPAQSVTSKMAQSMPDYLEPKTSCILAEPRLIPVKFDRAASPVYSFDAADTAPSRSNYLLPLACALASKDPSTPVAPLITWSTLLLPFQGGFSYSSPLLPRNFGAEVSLSDRVAEIEEWARTVDRAHVPSVDIAARRVVSAIAHRLDRSDALIDAVMVWENLVGTSTEVTFRVSAALAKLLEGDAAKRRTLRNDLSAIYDIRSRLVHGDMIDESRLPQASTDAIGFAVKALCACYKRGRDWLSLSSKDRSDIILLEWP
jgi:hypothetical protein